MEPKQLVAQSFATADAMELDDSPTQPKLFQKVTNTKQSWAQDFADEFDKEETDAGIPHDIHQFTMTEIHSMSNGQNQPEAKQSEEMERKVLGVVESKQEPAKQEQKNQPSLMEKPKSVE